MLKNSHNPQFVKAIEVTYQFEVVQKMKFEVYDVDNGVTAAVSSDFCLGLIECTLAEVRERHWDVLVCLDKV